MAEICIDNRFELIEKFKKELIEATNIEASQEEMKVLNNILFRFWQMGWLESIDRMPLVKESAKTLVRSVGDSASAKAFRNAGRFIQNAIDGEAPEFEKIPSASPDLSEEDMRLIKKLRSFHNGSYAVVLDKLITSACNETKQQATKVSDCISRQKVIDALSQYPFEKVVNCISIIEELPSVEPEKENPRRVLWSGWKGTRYTRYKCPNCNKPVKNDDVHCHRCGQKLMFPHISHTPYIEGQKQELIVRWDDEE